MEEWVTRMGWQEVVSQDSLSTPRVTEVTLRRSWLKEGLSTSSKRDDDTMVWEAVEVEEQHWRSSSSIAGCSSDVFFSPCIARQFSEAARSCIVSGRHLDEGWVCVVF